MRRTACALGLVLAVVGLGAAPASAVPGNPQRPAGPVVPFVPSANGGDNGWGNCGHNSSGGRAHSDPNHRGNGGYKKGADCGSTGGGTGTGDGGTGDGGTGGGNDVPDWGDVDFT